MSKTRRAMKLAGSLGLLFLCFTVGVSTAPWELPPIEPLTSKPLSVMLTTHDSLTTVKSFYLAEGQLIVRVSHNRVPKSVSIRLLTCLRQSLTHSRCNVAPSLHFLLCHVFESIHCQSLGTCFLKAIILFKRTLKT